MLTLYTILLLTLFRYDKVENSTCSLLSNNSVKCLGGNLSNHSDRAKLKETFILLIDIN